MKVKNNKFIIYQKFIQKMKNSFKNKMKKNSF